MFAFLATIATAQQGSIFDKIYVGGGFGFNLDANYFSFNVTPIIDEIKNINPVMINIITI